MNKMPTVDGAPNPRAGSSEVAEATSTLAHRVISLLSSKSNKSCQQSTSAR
jgi:hypothetical protein